MFKIPKIEKSRGNPSADLKYGLQFEGYLRALEIENDKRLDILLCYLEETAFPHLCNLRTDNANIIYVQVKD